MDLKSYIEEKITTLDATGDKTAAVKYFQTKLPDLTRQKLAGYKRAGTYPFEFAEAIFEQDFTAEPDAATPPPEINGAGMIATPPPNGIDPNDPNALEDENWDGTTVPAMPENYAPPMMVPGTNSRVIPGQRTPDIAVIDPNRRAANPAAVAPPVDVAEITRAVMNNLIGAGWQPPASSPQPAAPRIRRNAPPAIRYNTKSGLPPQRQWNESQQAFAVRMSQGG